MNQCLHAWLQNTLGKNALQPGLLGCAVISVLWRWRQEGHGSRLFSVSLRLVWAARDAVSNRGRDQGVGRHDTAWYGTCHMLHHGVDLNPQTDVKGQV